MQGGLITATEAQGQYQTMGGRAAMPDATGVPALPGESAQQATVRGRGPGVSVTTTTGDMGPFERLVTGTSWTTEDLQLALQLLSTLILLYWAMTEVR